MRFYFWLETHGRKSDRFKLLVCPAGPSFGRRLPLLEDAGGEEEQEQDQASARAASSEPIPNRRDEAWCLWPRHGHHFGFVRECECSKGSGRTRGEPTPACIDHVPDAGGCFLFAQAALEAAAKSRREMRRPQARIPTTSPNQPPPTTTSLNEPPPKPAAATDKPVETDRFVFTDVSSPVGIHPVSCCLRHTRSLTHTRNGYG